ncbi:Uncharacterised protein [Halioglobus japonicus]|nr:Uncharacterised protein [Halioglobus japonicus]
MGEVERLWGELVVVQPLAACGGRISDEATAVLSVYAVRGATALGDDMLLQSFDFGMIELEAPIRELAHRDVLYLGSMKGMSG